MIASRRSSTTTWLYVPIVVFTSRWRSSRCTRCAFDALAQDQRGRAVAQVVEAQNERFGDRDRVRLPGARGSLQGAGWHHPRDRFRCETFYPRAFKRHPKLPAGTADVLRVLAEYARRGEETLSRHGLTVAE